MIDAQKQRVLVRQLRRDNVASLATRPKRDFFKKLDSNLKKNTAFLKRVKLVGADNIDAVLLEYKKLVRRLENRKKKILKKIDRKMLFCDFLRRICRDMLVNWQDLYWIAN